LNLKPKTPTQVNELGFESVWKAKLFFLKF
jgi:hypothetical protein